MSSLDTVVDVRGVQQPLRALVKDQAALKEALDALPIDTVLAVAVDPEAPAFTRLVEKTGFDLSPRLTAAHVGWARAVLDAACAAPTHAEWPVRWAFVGLARAGQRCEPRWERLFPTIPMFKPALARAAAIEAARTLPPERVCAVASEAMARHPATAPQLARAILEVHDDEALARHLLALRSAGLGREGLRTLLHPLADRPGIARALATDAETAGPTFQVVSRHSPLSPTELDPTRSAQLEQAGDLLEGAHRPLAERWALLEGEGSFGGLCEHLRLAASDGTLAVDAWRYAGDSGAVFRADTVEVIATIVQGGVQCAPGQPAWLEDALADALT